MKIICLIISLISMPLIAYNQASGAINNNTGGAIEAQIAIGTLAVDNFRTKSLEYDDVKGTPYVEDGFLLGHVVLIDNKKTSQTRLQYDIYTNEFIYIDNNEQELIIDLKLVRAIVMHGKKESYLFKRINPLQPRKFYEILYEGEDLDIYNEMEINFREGKDQGIVKIEPSFARDDHYYVLGSDKKPKKIKLKKKDILKLFSKEKQQFIETTLKQQKLKLKKAKDFKKLFSLMKDEYSTLN